MSESDSFLRSAHPKEGSAGVRDATTVTIVFGAKTWADGVLGEVDQDDARGEQGIILRRAVANATNTL